MSKELKIIKAKIKTRLIELDMTQAELAKQVSVASSVISELLKYGKGSEPVKEKVIERKNMSKELKIIKAKIKTRLIELDMTQAELAKQVSVASSVISELLKYGKGSEPVKEKVADVLGIENPWRNH
ncbi:putative phage DNA binding protein [Streptococcus pneumoniae]|nr:putative phage DNA binding protein [Streptococcus pneumoniae]